jgi:hypothetical protein
MRRILALLVLAGCTSSHEGGPAARGSDSTSCETRAADLSAWAAMVVQTYGADVAADKLVEVRDASPVPSGHGPVATLSVSRDGIAVDDRPTTDARGIAERLRATRGWPAGLLFLAIDGDAPMTFVSIAADGAIAAGVRDVQVAVARTVTPMTPPPRSAVTDELDASAGRGPAEHAIAISRVMRRVTADCPEFISALTAGGNAGAKSKAQLMIDAIQPGLTGCSCKLDLDALRSTLWALSGSGAHRPAGVVPVTLAAADDRAATLVTGATWADAAPALFTAAADGKPVRFVAAASP